uniref:Uncharacterized protein n=1 Tax=Trepomonas sp. PC1 TaxID=1076344 RepID=A0A146K892_9EUKA|eukprot:JAP91796.1 hypothetical protein TPC1_16476 [Trepomonas sp. PC1]
MNREKRHGRVHVDREFILSIFADYVNQVTKIPKEQLLKDLLLLDSKVNDLKHELPWDQIAFKSGIDRWRLYHWFFETFERSLQGCMTQEDLNILRHEVHKAISRGVMTDKQFQNELKHKLSRQYHRSTFSIAFNNARRALIRQPAMVMIRDARRPATEFKELFPMQKKTKSENSEEEMQNPPTNNLNIPFLSVDGKDFPNLQKLNQKSEATKDEKRPELWGKQPEHEGVFETSNQKTKQLLELLGRHDEPNQNMYDYPFDGDE